MFIKKTLLLLLTIGLLTLEAAFSQGSISLPEEHSIADHVPHYATKETTFERVISIGKNCLTKAQINLYFDPRHLEWPTKSGKSDIFDWAAIPNYQLLTSALTHRLEGFYEREDFYMIANNIYGLTNKRNGVRWVHTLKKYEDQIPKDKIDDGEFLLSVFHEHFEEEYSKAMKLKDRFLRAEHKKTLYIISHAPGISLEQLLQLRDALLIARNQNKQFAILYVSKNQGTADFENIFMREAKNVSEDTKLTLDPDCWRAIFSEFNFTDDIWE